MKVLVVDDNAIARDLLSTAVTRAGHQLLEATNGAECLAKATRERPQVVLLDVMMPGMSGFDVCRSLRAVPALRDVVVILVTALDDSEARVAGFDAGADEFITKPFDRIELIARLRAIDRLDRYRRLSQYDELARLSPDALLAVDEQGVVTFLNPTAQNWFGHITGKSLTSLVAGNDGTLAEWRALVAAATPSTTIEAEFVRHDGTTFVGEMTLGVIATPSTTHATAIVRDRSEHAMLRARVEQTQRFEAIAQATAGIAHDLSNYLFAL